MDFKIIFEQYESHERNLTEFEILKSESSWYNFSQSNQMGILCFEDGLIHETNNRLSKRLKSISNMPITLIDYSIFDLDFKRISNKSTNEKESTSLKDVTQGQYELRVGDKIMNINIIEVN